MRSIHSGLSTQKKGKLAEAVSLAILSSNFLWNSGGHTPESSINMDCDHDLGVGWFVMDWPGLSNGLWSIGTTKWVYGEGRAEREEVEPNGECACVGGIDGGNI